MKNNLIGLFGGTFDPVHYGHLELAAIALKELDLSEVRFIPCYRSPHKNQPLASAEDRFEMISLAIANEAKFTLDSYEIKHKQASYTVDTLRAMRSQFGSETPLCLIMALDAFLKFDLWHQWQEIPKLAHLAVTNRPGSAASFSSNVAALLEERQIQDKALLKLSPAGRIIFFQMPPNPVSATEIRTKIKLGESPEKLLPAPVWEYIENQHLYR